MLRVRARHRGDTHRGECLSGEDPDFPEEGRTQQAKSPGGIPEADRGPRVVGPDHGSQPKEGHPDPNMQDTSAVGQGARKEETGGSKTSDLTSKTPDLRHPSGRTPRRDSGTPCSRGSGKDSFRQSGKDFPAESGKNGSPESREPWSRRSETPCFRRSARTCLPSICSSRLQPYC